MSNIGQVAVTTVTLIDPTANHQKFYRTFALGDYVAYQWGRIGTAGQFKIEGHSGRHARDTAAQGKIRAKQAKGYGSLRGNTFSFDLDNFERLLQKGDKAAGNALAATLEAIEAGVEHVPTTPMPTQTEPPRVERQPSTSTLEAFSERALSAIQSAAVEPSKGAVAYATLRDEWAALEEQVNRGKSYLETLETMLLEG